MGTNVDPQSNDYSLLGAQLDKVEALKEAQSLILRLLTRRISKVPPTMRSQIENLSLAQLEFLGEVLLDFANVEDLESWLRLHS